MTDVTKSVVTTDDLGIGFEFDNNNKKINVVQSSGGLDCAVIAALPETQWKKGTSILVNQDGECKRLVPIQNLFQEIGITLHANKLSATVGENYHVIATITNSGEATNERSDVVFVKPKSTGYTVSGIRTSVIGADRVEEVDENNFAVHKLRSGGVAKIEFDVTSTEVGTFQFGASVNANSAFDMQTNNNQATITLSAVLPATPQDPKFVPTQECPSVEVRYQGEELNLGLDAQNIFTDLDSLRGLEFSLANATTIAAHGAINSKPFSRKVFAYGTFSDNNPIFNADFSKYILGGDMTNVLKSDTTAPFKTGHSSTSNDAILEDKTLRITGDVRSIVIAIRPESETCKWQYLVLSTPNKVSVPTRSRCVQQVTGYTLEPKLTPLTRNFSLTSEYLTFLTDLSNGIGAYGAQNRIVLANNLDYLSVLNRHRIKLIGNAHFTTVCNPIQYLPTLQTRYHIDAKVDESQAVREVYVKPGETVQISGCSLPAVTATGRLQVTTTGSGNSRVIDITASTDATESDYIRADNSDLLIAVKNR